MTRLHDRFDLLEPLGKGSFAHTWRATDAATGATVAVKILDQKSADWKGRELFEREAQVLAGLRHPGIPAVVVSFRAMHEGVETSCLAMEYVEGTSLATVIGERRRMSDADAVTALVDMLGILDYLHTRVPPVVHRDIKPANIILRPNGAPSLVDFGSVREGFAGPSEAGSTVAGTYGYMPYEQYMGQALPSSDLYALGATMLHLLTGKAPREFMTAEGRIAVPAELAGGAHVRGVIARMLAQSPAERFATARDVQRAIAVPTALDRAPTAGAVSLAPGATRVSPAVDLGPAPRELTGPTRAHMQKVALSMWELMDADEKHTGNSSALELALFTFFCVITAGILPAVFGSMARNRRRRTELFFREGTAASATVTDIRIEKGPFEVKMAHVQYEFSVDGRLHRDRDQILPSLANRWRVGDTIQVLFIADRGYDSIVVSTE